MISEICFLGELMPVCGNPSISIVDMDDWKSLYKNGGYAGFGSGTGSLLDNNRTLIYWLNGFLEGNNIKSILDVACGDMQWMPFVNLSGKFYLGIDYVDYLIRDNEKKFPKLRFACIDILDDNFKLESEFDLVFCKDVLHHCSPEEKNMLFKNIRKIKSKFLIMVVPFTHPIHDAQFLFEYQSDERKQVYLL